MRIDRRSAVKLLAAPALLGGLHAFASSARAQQYPGKPIRIIVPYPAGGPYDGIPRLIAQWIGAQQGWSIVIDNRTGAAGVIGVMAAKQAAPDGHTLVVATTSTHGSMPALKRNRATTRSGLRSDRTDGRRLLGAAGAGGAASAQRRAVDCNDAGDPVQLNYSTGGYGSPHISRP